MNNIGDYHTYKFIVDKFSNREIEDMANIMKKRGNWIEAKEDSQNINFIYAYCVYSEYPQKYWNIQTDIISTMKLRHPRISDKDIFYSYFKKFFPEKCRKYMPLQYDINSSNYANINKNIFENNRFWLAKLSAGFGGKRNKLLTSWDQFMSFFQEFYSGEKIARIPSNKWVLSYYIKNPLLINGYKFHLRVPLIYYYGPLVTNNKNGIGYVAMRSMIFTAKKPYVNDDWENSDIHDSRLRISYARDLEYPKDLDFLTIEKRQHIDDQIYDISACIIQIINKTNSIACFEKTTYCYYIFGMDILIDANYHAKILEINENAVIFNDNPDYKKSLIDSMVYNLVDPLFPPANKMTDNGFFRKVDPNNKIYFSKYQKYKKKYINLKNSTADQEHTKF